MYIFNLGTHLGLDDHLTSWLYGANGGIGLSYIGKYCFYNPVPGIFRLWVRRIPGP